MRNANPPANGVEGWCGGLVWSSVEGHRIVVPGWYRSFLSLVAIRHRMMNKTRRTYFVRLGRHCPRTFTKPKHHGRRARALLVSPGGICEISFTLRIRSPPLVYERVSLFLRLTRVVSAPAIRSAEEFY